MNKELIPSRGAIAEPLILEVRRELTPVDLQRAGDAPKVGTPVIQKLRATHHRQALLLAQGKSVKEVASIVGCTPQRITQLQTDPMFVELLSIYKDQMIVASLEGGQRLQAKIIDAGEMAVDELVSRLENDKDRAAMPVGEVRKIAEFAMDRTVAPPKSAPQQNTTPAVITMNFGTGLRPQVETSVTIEHEPTAKDKEE